jgi:hypothetical protein
MKNPENPPAFPLCVTDERSNEYNAQGMDLRDYFAAKAMPTVIDRHWKSYLSIWARIQMIGERGYAPDIKHYHFINTDYVARTSYEMADAMLKERVKP